MKSLSQSDQQQLRGTAKILQAVTTVMAAGAVIGAIVIIGLVPEALNSEPKMLVLLGAFTACISYGLSFVVAAIFKQPIPADDVPTEEQVSKASQQVLNSHIIRSTIIEAGIFLNLMVLLLERNFISVAVIGLGFLLLCILFTTHGGLVGKVSQRLR